MRSYSVHITSTFFRGKVGVSKVSNYPIALLLVCRYTNRVQQQTFTKGTTMLTVTNMYYKHAANERPLMSGLPLPNYKKLGDSVSCYTSPTVSSVKFVDCEFVRTWDPSTGMKGAMMFAAGGG